MTAFGDRLVVGVEQAVLRPLDPDELRGPACESSSAAPIRIVG